MTTEFSENDIRLLETIRNSPIHLSWNWTLRGGATLKVEIVGRWGSEDAGKARHIMGLINDVIDDAASESDQSA